MKSAQVAVVPFGLGIGDLVNMRPLVNIIRAHYPDRTMGVVAPKELAWLLPHGTHPLTDARGLSAWKRPSPDDLFSRIVGRLTVGQISPLVRALPVSALARGLDADLRARGHSVVVNLLGDFAALNLDKHWTLGPSNEERSHVIDLLTASLRARGMAVDSGTLKPGLTLPRRRPLNAPAIILYPAAGSTLKEAPIGLWEVVARELVRAGLRPLLLTAPGRDLSQRVFHRVPGCVLLSSTDLPMVASWIAGADMFISPDTGLLHIAAAVGVPFIGLFGSTDPRFTGPYPGHAGLIVETPARHREVCRSCWTAQILPIARCPIYGPETCLGSIEPEAVLDAIWRLTATAVKASL